MTDSEKIKRLKELLAYQLEQYHKYTELERTGEVDASYVYDCAQNWFDEEWVNLSTLLGILADE